MKYYILLVACFGIVLAGCTPRSSLEKDLQENPLVQEFIGDRMVEYVSTTRIHAQEAGNPITDPAKLREFDAALVRGKSLRNAAHKAEDAGKSGDIYGVNDNFAKGEALLEKTNKLHFSYTFEIDAAPEIVVYLAQSVAPRTRDDLFSEQYQKVGVLQSIYGAQTYDVESLSSKDWDVLRTVAFYSEALQEIIAIAQIRGR